MTADGKDLLIHTSARLDRGADHDADADIYRWSEEGGWLCLSCQLPGVPSAGPSEMTFLREPSGGFRAREYRNVMSEDGQRVFFTSNDALVPEDTNERADVYEWNDGTTSLISTGIDTTDAKLLGASTSGRDVFFTTYQRLVGWDTDANADIYDARIGGGFPEPPPTGAPCEGEACRGAPTSSPPAIGAGSAAFQGPGNPTPGHHCKRGFVRRHGKCVKNKKRRHKHHHRAAARRSDRASKSDFSRGSEAEAFMPSNRRASR